MDKYFIEIMENLGPTITGVKPGELLNVKLSTWPKIKETLEHFKEIKVMAIKKLKKTSRLQVLVYNDVTLKKTISNKPIHSFLVKQGFPSNICLESYLVILRDRLRSNQFPHEIGIFLGYPLKDVLGYMGYPLKLVEINGWRYYGSRKLSHNYYLSYQQEKENFGKLLRGIEKPEEFYNYIN